MAEFRHPIVDEVAELTMPEPDGAMITHSSALYVRGILPPRPDSDIDLCVNKVNFAYLRDQESWRVYQREYRYDSTTTLPLEYLRSDDQRFDVFPCDWIPVDFIQRGKGRKYWDELVASHNPLDDQDRVTGIWVASVVHVAATKRYSFFRRDKDVATLRRIDQYLEQGY